MGGRGGGTKRFVEGHRRHKHLRVKEVQQRPELVQVVLDGGASEKQLALARHLPQALVDVGLLVLDTVAFVEYQIAPADPAAECRPHVRRARHLVGGHHDVERPQVRKSLGPHQLAFLAVGGVEPHHTHRRCPLPELGEPVAEDGEWADNEVRAGETMLCAGRGEGGVSESGAGREESCSILRDCETDRSGCGGEQRAFRLLAMQP